MNAIRLLTNELKLLSRSLMARLFFLFTVMLGIVGINATQISDPTVYRGMVESSAQTSLGSASYAAVGGAAFFAMLTLLVLSRDKRSHSVDLLESSRNYRQVVLARIAALLVWAFLTALGTALAGSASHVMMSDAAYELDFYLFSYSFVTLPALVLSVLICSGLYLMFESLDVSFLTFGIVFLLGFKSSNYLLRWLEGGAGDYSDFGGIEPVAQYVVYNRLFMLSAATALLLFGLLVMRRPGADFMSSVTRNLKGITIPVAFLGMVALSACTYLGEPYVYRSSTPLLEKLPTSDVSQLEEVESRLTLNTRHGSLEAVATYRFKKDQEACMIIFAANAGLVVDSVRVNGETGSWQGLPQPDRIRVALPRGRRAEVELTYHGTIKNPAAGLFVGYICDKSVYLLENGHWLLTPLTKNSEAIRVSGSIVAPEELTVATPGRCDSVVSRDASRVWSYSATTTSLNMGVFASDYRILRVRAGDMDVEFYVSSRHEEAFRAAKLDKHAQEILEHYQASIGPYPFEGWPVKVVEVPIYKPGGHSSLNVVTLAENMLHRRPPVTPTDEMLFLAHDLKLIAHELAHQWWGSGVEVAGQDEWTSEGLAEYTVYRYYADKHPGTATDFIVRSWQTAVDADRNNYYVRHPEVLKKLRPEFAKQVASGSLVTRVYNAMPLKLIQAEQHLGVEVFQEKLSAVYRNHCRGVLHLDEFLAETGLTEEIMALD